MLLVFKVVSIISLTIRPLENPVTMHLIVLPLALVLAAIAPDICALAFDVVVNEVALVYVVVAPSELSESLLDALMIVAFEL